MSDDQGRTLAGGEWARSPLFWRSFPALAGWVLGVSGPRLAHRLSTVFARFRFVGWQSCAPAIGQTGYARVRQLHKHGRYLRN